MYITIVLTVPNYPQDHGHQHETEEEKLRFIEDISLYIIAGLGVLSNMLLIICVLAQRDLRKMTNAFVIHNSLINAVLALFCIPFSLASTPELHLGNQCNALGITFIVLMTTAVFNLLAMICCETYLLKDDNLSYDLPYPKGNICCVLFGISLIYASSVVLHLGPTIIGGNFQPGTEGTCEFIYKQSKNYIVFVMWTVIVSIALAAGLYYLIILYRVLQNNLKATTSSSYDCQNMRHFLVEISNRAKIMTVLLFLHFFCWYPLFIMCILDPSFSVALNMYKILTAVGWSLPAIQPWIFIIGDPRINRIFRSRLPCCRAQRKKFNSNPSLPTFHGHEQLPLMRSGCMSRTSSEAVIDSGCTKNKDMCDYQWPRRIGSRLGQSSAASDLNSQEKSQFTSSLNFLEKLSFHTNFHNSAEEPIQNSNVIFNDIHHRCKLPSPPPAVRLSNSSQFYSYNASRISATESACSKERGAISVSSLHHDYAQDNVLCDRQFYCSNKEFHANSDYIVN